MAYEITFKMAIQYETKWHKIGFYLFIVTKVQSKLTPLIRIVALKRAVWVRVLMVFTPPPLLQPPKP